MIAVDPLDLEFTALPRYARLWHKSGERSKLPDLPPEPSLRGAASYLSRLAREWAFLDSWISPLLEEPGRSEDWYVAYRHDVPDGSYTLQLFVWPPGCRTRVHDHSSWGAFCCVAGAVLEERYERLDDGSRCEYARLRGLWRKVWHQGSGVSVVLPYGGGVHRVGNPNTEKAISVHLYGPRPEGVDGRDYDPSRNYVCDRFDTE